jgi:hypothetical protein
VIEAVSRFSNSRKGPEIRLVSLKKRHDASGHQKIVFRAVPVPTGLLNTLNTAHGTWELRGFGSGRS